MYYAFSSVRHNLYVRVFPIWEQNYRLNNINNIKSVHFKLFYDLIVSGGKRVWSMNKSNTVTMAQYLLIAHWNLWLAISHFSRVNRAQDDRKKTNLFSWERFFAARARGWNNYKMRCVGPMMQCTEGNAKIISIGCSSLARRVRFFFFVLCIRFFK